jgi:hypothetical protein
MRSPPTQPGQNTAPGSRVRRQILSINKAELLQFQYVLSYTQNRRSNSSEGCAADAPMADT